MNGVMRLLGAAEEEMEHETILTHPAMQSQPVSHGVATERIIEHPGKAESTLFVARPEIGTDGDPQFSLRTYAGYLLTRQALVVDVNALAATDLEEATRVVDYLSGVAEAVDGTVWEVTKNIFIFAASNIQLAGDPLKQVEVY